MVRPDSSSKAAGLPDFFQSVCGFARRCRPLGECCDHIARLVKADVVAVTRITTDPARDDIVATGSSSASAPDTQAETFKSIVDSARLLVTPDPEEAEQPAPEHNIRMTEILIGRPGCHYVLCVVRASGDFDDDEQTLLELVVEQFRQSIALREEKDQAVWQVMVSRHVFDHMPYGLVGLDCKGNLGFRNREAARIFAEADGLICDNGRLKICDENVAAELEQTLASLASVDSSTLHGRNVCLKRPSGKPGYELTFIPIFIEADSFLLNRRTMLVVIRDPLENHRPNVDYLRDVYGLTPAEARLCQCLSQGRDLEAAALELGIAITTAKTQLMSSYRKLNVSSRAGLIHRLQSHYWPAAPIVIRAEQWEASFGSG